MQNVLYLVFLVSIAISGLHEPSLNDGNFYLEESGLVACPFF
jgi:hypothetical protein